MKRIILTLMLAVSSLFVFSQQKIDYLYKIDSVRYYKDSVNYKTLSSKPVDCKFYNDSGRAMLDFTVDAHKYTLIGTKYLGDVPAQGGVARYYEVEFTVPFKEKGQMGLGFDNSDNLLWIVYFPLSGSRIIFYVSTDIQL